MLYKHPGEANLSIIPVRTDGLRGEVGEGVISREYNLWEPNANVTYSRTGKGLISIMQVLYPHRPGETASPRVRKVPVYRHTGERVHDGQAEACGVQLPEWKRSLYSLLVTVRRQAIMILLWWRTCRSSGRLC